jgi:hypothetical protein
MFTLSHQPLSDHSGSMLENSFFLDVLSSYGTVYQPDQNTFVLSLHSIILFIVLILVVLPHLVFKVPVSAYWPWHFVIQHLNSHLSVFAYSELNKYLLCIYLLFLMPGHQTMGWGYGTSFVRHLPCK